MKILHILYQSLPQVSGSSIRSRDILMSQQNVGLDAVAITSGFQGSLEGGNEDIINGVRYIRTNSSKNTVITDKKKSVGVQLKKLFSIVSFSYKLYRCVKREKPDVLHAHAMFFCGIPAVLIGKLRKIPVVYEFRSLWMFQDKKGKKSKLELFIERRLVALEAYTLKKADAAVFLNDDLKTYFTSKGMHFKRAYVIDNAVNLDYIQKLALDTSPKEISKTINFGYIGTLTAYEGIEFLVQSFQELYDEGIRPSLLIYGRGISQRSVVKLIQDRPDIETIKYLGSIAPDEVPGAYAQMDVIINPRLDNEVTQSVTPLKPLEAMAYDKLFIGSDVGGITALVKANINGFIFRAEDKESLKATIKKVINLSETEKKALHANALEYVKREKSWKKNALVYKGLYTSLINEYLKNNK